MLGDEKQVLKFREQGRAGEKSGKNRVLAIGLDSADPKLMEAYMRKGYMPTLARLRRQGAYGRLRNFDLFSAETPWTTFATGCSPHTVGYWSPLKFDKDRYRMKTRAAYEFDEVPPFFALGKDYKVAVFDVPQVRICPKVSGIQVGAWGAHSPQVPSASSPPDLYAQLIEKHGNHPGLHDDYAECLDLSAVERLRKILPIGIQRRADICIDLLAREPWDLFLTVFGEPHTIGHNMLQVSSPDHPLYEHLSPKVQGDPLKEIYEAIDFSMGRIIEAAGDDVTVIVFSAHGMGPNTMDLPSTSFLPELLYRMSFPGARALCGAATDQPPPPLVLKCLRDSWLWEVWSHMHEANPVIRLLRQHAPWGVLKHIEPRLSSAANKGVASPFALMDQGVREVPVQPTSWFMPLWPQMKAFALPSFSEGYIRLNVKGREPEGVVAREAFTQTVNEIVAALEQLVDARTGVRMVRRIERVRSDAFDADPKLPDADIVVGWQEDHATDVVDSPLVGRIGPLPHFRAGSHRSEGFVAAAGPGIEKGSTLTGGHALDLAPTILHLMGAPLPKHLEGKPLLSTAEGELPMPEAEKQAV